MSLPDLRLSRRSLVVGTAAAAVSSLARAQAYPGRPIRIVIPFPPGGGTDAMVRLLALKLRDAMGQPVLVDNRPGGDTIIAAEMVANAPPDGHTLLVAHFSTMALNPHLYPKLPYDPVKDFAPISQLTYTSIGLVAGKKLAANNMQELVKYAKANPGKLTYGHSFLVAKMYGEYFKSAAGVDIVDVPYKGSGPILPALLSGEIDLAVTDLSPFVPHVESGTIRVLGTSGARRYSQLPQVPTMRELGFPALELRTWFGLYAPAGTPAPIVERLNAEVNKVFKDPAVVKDLQTRHGYDPVPSTPQQLTALLKADSDKWGPVIKQLGLKAQ
jgi:tripartite-type tricarboxylate transporter receptor subunit TctC